MVDDLGRTGPDGIEPHVLDRLEVRTERVAERRGLDIELRDVVRPVFLRRDTEEHERAHCAADECTAVTGPVEEVARGLVHEQARAVHVFALGTALEVLVETDRRIRGARADRTLVLDR